MLGHDGAISVARARGEARKLLARAARGEDPAGEACGGAPHADAGEGLRAPHGRQSQAGRGDRQALPRGVRPATSPIGASALWPTSRGATWRPVSNRITEDSGWSPANRTISLLSSIYRRPCVDFDGLRNAVDLWLAGGGKFHRNRRRKISTPEEVLPRWKKGVEEAIATPCVRDAFWFGFYTGMRLREVLPLRWKRVDMAALVFRVEETKTGAPLELPITRQLATVLERRFADSGASSDDAEDWVFPSALPGALGHIADLSHHYRRIGEAGGTRFW